LKQAQEEFKIAETTQTDEDVSLTEHSEETTEGSEPLYSDIEKEAMEQGWKPGYDGPNKKSAEQFIKDGSFFKKIDAQNKEINELRQAFKNLSQIQKKTEKVTYEKALAELRAVRDAAVEVGDVERVRSLDPHLDEQKEKIKELDRQAQVEASTEAQVTDQAPHQEAVNFRDRNKAWFGNFNNSNVEALQGDEKRNYQMTKAALAYDDYIGMKVKMGELKISPDQHIKAVEDFIKETYPDKFTNPNRSAPAAVVKSSSASSGDTSTGKLSAHLSDRQKEQYKLYKSIDPKFGTLDEFAKHLDIIGELKK
ncbi:MAG TPA: hypothetical protein VGF75_04665, partial [Candidatus Saccharimonadales bacterium]